MIDKKRKANAPQQVIHVRTAITNLEKLRLKAYWKWKIRLLKKKQKKLVIF